MADTVLAKPDPEALNDLIRAQGLALHAKDQPPATRKAWEERRSKLRAAMFTAMGPFPEKPCPLETKTIGVLKRQGYRIEKLIFQSRPDVWVTASAYVPVPARGRLPAVLVVHGHWAGARRDPVVQARCLGLVKLGFVVLAVDAFGAGERYTTPALGTYHGALYGNTLWPAGQTLLGMQVYDNRRAVDYLRGRPEVDGSRLGITGASGGGNQTMYAGALDERFQAVVPVCSVGTYQAYLHAACCVCEVLPGGLRLAEEGDVLALVAPRALMVVNATQDGFQFSVGEAKKSLARARAVFKLYAGDGKIKDVEDRLRHAIFESPHAYNQEMREAMYGWMTRWLKNEGTGKPIPEPKHEVEKPDDLRCFADKTRPKGFLFPPSFAAREGQALIAKIHAAKLDHVEAWESTAVHMRSQLRKEILGDFPTPPKPNAKLGTPSTKDNIRTTPLVIYPEPKLPVPALVRYKPVKGRVPACILLHLGGKAEALKHPLAAALLEKNYSVIAPDLRGIGETRPAHDAIVGAPDHNSAEHGLWIGRPLLGQWVFDVQCLLDWMGWQPGLDKSRFAVVGLGQAGIVALCASGLFDDRITSTAAIGMPVTYITEEAYGPGTYMGLLAPGILRVGDIPHLAALAAPRKLLLAEGVSPQGQKISEKEMVRAFAFTRTMYKLNKSETKLVVKGQLRAETVAAAL
jgi:dienelactone hydrolase/pimeloyl-ACP methyl ester carboxylesterase